MVSLHSSPNITVRLFNKHPSLLRTVFSVLIHLLFVIVFLDEFGVVSTLVLPISVVLHEYGHYSVCKRYNLSVGEICISPTHGFIKHEPTDNPYHSASIAAAGPIFGLLPLFVLIPVALFTTVHTLPIAVFIVAAVNLPNYIPYGDIDGGVIRNAVMHILQQSDRLHWMPDRLLFWTLTIIQCVALLLLTTILYYSISDIL